MVLDYWSFSSFLSRITLHWASSVFMKSCWLTKAVNIRLKGKDSLVLVITGTRWETGSLTEASSSIQSTIVIFPDHPYSCKLNGQMSDFPQDLVALHQHSCHISVKHQINKWETQSVWVNLYLQTSPQSAVSPTNEPCRRRHQRRWARVRFL